MPMRTDGVNPNKALPQADQQPTSTKDAGAKSKPTVVSQKASPEMTDRLASIGLDAPTTPVTRNAQAELVKKMAEIQSAVWKNNRKSSERYELGGVVSLYLKKEQYESQLYVNGQLFGWVKGGDIQRQDSEVAAIESIDDLLKRSGVGTIAFNTWPHYDGLYSDKREIDISKVTFLGSDT